jgi:hypothetical protein
VEVYFHKIKKTLSRSDNDLNTTDDNTGVPESFSAIIELCNASIEI